MTSMTLMTTGMDWAGRSWPFKRSALQPVQRATPSQFDRLWKAVRRRDGETRGHVVELVVGPLCKSYVCAYLIEDAPDASTQVAYVKICRTQPASYWEAKPVLKLAIDVDGLSTHEALRVALDRARLHLDAGGIIPKHSQ